MPELWYDSALYQGIGTRELQEDALAADFPLDGRLAFVVLADGMGGHAAGEIASTIVVTEVFSELKFQAADPDRLAGDPAAVLREAALAANDCLAAHARANPETAGMGATLVAPILLDDHLHWISVGDSLLFLLREDQITRLNEDHSLAPQIDFMVRKGLLDPDLARDHPDRNCLTSVLGGEPIERIDCPDKPLALRPGDILIVASDGLQALEEPEIASLARNAADQGSATIARALAEAIEARALPQQDNVSFCVIRVLDRTDIARPAAPSQRRHTAQILPLRPGGAEPTQDQPDARHDVPRDAAET